MTLYKLLYFNLSLSLVALCVVSCSQDVLNDVQGDVDNSEPSVINVGVDMDVLTMSSTTTRATEDAEKVPWLVQPLKNGLDITYGKVASTEQEKQERVAILKLKLKEGGTDVEYETDPSSGFAVYTFNYRSEDGKETTELAKWKGNGLHYFEGVHVPNRLRYKESVSELTNENRTLWDAEQLKAVNNLTSDQSDDTDTGADNDLGNYILLSHYLGMPAKTQISATVSRIKLPFRHRLARVLAYILIDPNLKTGNNDAKIRGYDNAETDAKEPFRDNPATSSIRFCNVDVLNGVHDEYDSGKQLHTLTPSWHTERKATPHFVEQQTNFIVYENKSTKALVYPKSSNYASVQADHSNYNEIKYNVVPVYDLIVRPTYTNADNVMYDEDLSGITGDTEEKRKQQYAAKSNSIDFTVTLDNGLTYEKNFTFDLNANYQTIVYLKITPEGVDYNESGSELWQEKTYTDDWFGLDNTNGNTLSRSGSSWQRAYYNNYLTGDKVTDGGYYSEDTQGEDGTIGQYVSDDTWKKYLFQAYKGAKCHGDYFVLDKDITIDAKDLPSGGIVFTGHLDGYSTKSSPAYHTITLSNAGEIFHNYTQETLDKLYDDDNAKHKVPQLYWFEEVAQSRPNTNSIEPFVPSEDNLTRFVMSKTYPADLDGFVIYYKKDDGEFALYTNRNFRKKSPSYLFAGLDGIYSTKQEDEQAAGHSIYNQGWQWEANVHLENGYWLPYRDVTGGDPAKHTGWRAEVINLKVKGGTLFSEDAVVTGNVQNCYEGTNAETKVTDRTPAPPKYK